MYCVTHQAGNWVRLTFIWVFDPSCPATQPFLPNSHLPKQNLADNGIAKIKVNPTQPSYQPDELPCTLGQKLKLHFISHGKSDPFSVNNASGGLY